MPFGTSTHGGKREGAGRKPLGPPMQRVTVNLTERHATWLRGLAVTHGVSISAVLRNVLDEAFGTNEPE